MNRVDFEVHDVTIAFDAIATPWLVVGALSFLALFSLAVFFVIRWRRPPERKQRR